MEQPANQSSGTPVSGTPEPGSREYAQRLVAARQHLGALKGFYIHAAVYIGVVMLLAVINIATGKPYWALWVALAWGIGLLGHRALLGNGLARWVRRWEQRQIAAYMKSDGKP